MKKTKKTIALVGGARPNFMKIAPLYHELEREGMSFYLINTGQHFDTAMAGQFFKEFNIKPHFSLSPSRQSVIKQCADIMLGIEEIFKKNKPDLVLVFGDVNSTAIAALVANKMGIPLGHVEAGLRSFNRKMPEEINRIVTDHISDILFVTEESGLRNLKKENHDKPTFFVGNIMIDTLKHTLPSISTTKEKFYFCTLHRAENVDHKKVFNDILNALEIVARDAKIYLPLHPRTKEKAEKFGLMNRLDTIVTLLPPLSYKDTLFYQKNASLILTDSGGVQEEASVLGVPCLTLRTETERPITVTRGTNTVAGVTKKSILQVYKKQTFKRKNISIPMWDGKASQRIVKIVKNILR